MQEQTVAKFIQKNLKLCKISSVQFSQFTGLVFRDFLYQKLKILIFRLWVKFGQIRTYLDKEIRLLNKSIKIVIKSPIRNKKFEIFDVMRKFCSRPREKVRPDFDYEK